MVQLSVRRWIPSNGKARSEKEGKTLSENILALWVNVSLGGETLTNGINVRSVNMKYSSVPLSVHRIRTIGVICDFSSRDP